MAARRDASIDLLRLLSTVAVVGIHTLIRTARMSFPLHCLYSLCFFAVPVFFLCSGYFVLNKPEISWRYVGHRLLRILCVTVFWEIIFLLSQIARAGDLGFVRTWIPLNDNLWFLVTLALLYALSPLLLRLVRAGRNARGGLILTLALGALCVGLQAVSLLSANSLQIRVPRIWRLWTYLFYFVLGSQLPRLEARLRGRYPLPLAGFVLVVTMCLAVVDMYFVRFRLNQMPVESAYDNFTMILYCLALFLFVRRLPLGPRLSYAIVRVSALAMGCYIIHPLPQLLVREFIPIYTSVQAVGFWMFYTAFSFAVSYLLNRFAPTRRLVNL